VLTLRTSVHDDLGDHASQEEPVQADCEPEACPVVPVFHNLKHVSIDVDFTIEVHLVESLHRDFATTAILHLVRIFVEGKVMLDWESRVFGLLILARRKG